MSKLDSINVYAQSSDQSVPLRQAAILEVVWKPAQINRRDRVPTIIVETGLQAGTTAMDITSKLEP